MSTSAKVGLITIVGIILFGIVITWKSDIFLEKGGFQLIGNFENVEGLTIGSDVRYRGFKVGKVVRIDPGPNNILIYSIINKGIIFPADSGLRVSFDGLVGLKFLEIKPGTSEVLYRKGDSLGGQKTSGIVDFVDIGAQNLQETKAILQTVKDLIQRPDMQRAFVGAVLNTEKVTEELRRLSLELRGLTQSILAIIGDPKFQADIKGTIGETHKTLASANEFFKSTGQLGLRPSANFYVGNRTNYIRANLDVVQNPETFVTFSLGENLGNTLSLLDIQLSKKINDKASLRIGMINQTLAGGVDFYASPKWTLSTDIYNLNNRPNAASVRLTSGVEVMDYLDFVIQADDVLNQYPNFAAGFKVKTQANKKTASDTLNN